MSQGIISIVQYLVVMVMKETIHEYQQRVAIKLARIEASLVEIFALCLISDKLTPFSWAQ